jgi:feruloyl esterase
VTPQKTQAWHAAVGETIGTEARDAADGAEDGAVGDPSACMPDLSALMCEAEGAEDASCLDEAEMAALEAWRAGPRDSTGDQLYPGGVPAGSEAFWPLWLTGPDGGAPLLDAFSGNFLAHMAFPDDPGAGYDPRDFDMDADPARMSAAAATYNADDPDISAFAAAGGKMIVYHGLADALVTPQKTQAWHAAVGETIGTEARDAAVSLHMIPGFDHCGILQGPAGITQADFDPLAAMRSWLETGTPPEDLRAE